MRTHPQDFDKVIGEIRFDMQPSESCGIQLRRSGQHTRVSKIFPGGLVAKWNVERRKSKRFVVEAGDVICSVNGITDSEAMRGELAKPGKKQIEFSQQAADVRHANCRSD